MSRAPHIAVVDDEKVVRDMVADYLRMRGYRVSLCEGGASLRQAFAEQLPDLIVLDLNLKAPQEDGFSILRELRKRSSVSIIVYTANDDVIDRVIGLELGADDYLAKRCELRELVARIQLVLGRRGSDARATAATGPVARAAESVEPERVRMGTKWLDHGTRALWDDAGKTQALAASEYILLKAFAANPNRVLSRERLLELASARDAEPYDRAVDVRIMRIRRKIEPDPARPCFIRTVRGGGYMFVPAGRD
jgi:two-component system, OmpR family, response regulator